jgi:hypothetical protein
LVKGGELFHSFGHHGSFSSEKAGQVVKKINRSIKLCHDSFENYSHIVITLGSAHFYRNISNGEIVANCHKFPSRHFEKAIFSRMEISSAAKVIIEKVRRLYPSIVFVFTVSPVKYLRDGLVENSLSKATLIAACHQICQENENSFYFPSYEIVSDELRDYRFYTEDLAHPNALACDYVFEKFMHWGLQEEEKEMYRELKEFLLAFQHKVLHPNTNENKHFQKEILRKAENICRNYPFLNLSREKDNLKQRIALLMG